jgi:uncharacterized protein (DUF2062 family)
MLPRRAVLHKYPLIGRFAPFLRRRAYLWSFRRRDSRRAYYIGSVLAFLPLFGIQLPLAAVAALAFRTNFMVTGGLQFITNPITAAPVYYATHRVGGLVLARFRGEPTPEPVARDEELVELGGYVTETLIHPLAGDTVEPTRLTTRVRTALMAMIVGGVLVGVAAGALLDYLDGATRRQLARHRPARAAAPTGADDWRA